jgi:hypothetical protein
MCSIVSLFLHWVSLWVSINEDLIRFPCVPLIICYCFIINRSILVT